VDKPEYDRPEDKETSGSKALVFLLLAIVVVAIFYFGIYR
jgi:preprotein translocase subunit YajC